MPKLVPKTLRHQAVILRQQGYSLNEISDQVQVRKSTVWYWIKKVPLSSQAQKILGGKKKNTGFKIGNTAWMNNNYPTNAKKWTNKEIVTLTKMYDSGLSTIDIARKLDRTTWGVISLMKRKNIAQRTSNESHKIKFLKTPLSFNPKINISPNEEKLKIAGLMLYWGEGAKKHQTVDFANSDPQMAKLFITFLRKIYRVNEARLRCQLYCFPGHNIHALTAFWSNLLNVPISQFTKPYVRPDGGIIHGKMVHGLIHVRYSDIRLLATIIQDIKNYSQLYL